MKFGPQRDAAGLGDVLLLTSVCKYFPMQHTIQLWPELHRFSVLFDHLAHVEITEDVNILPNRSIPQAHGAVEKLRNFFGYTADTCNALPLVLHFDLDAHEQAISILKGIKDPVIFNPYCSPHWSHIRNMPEEYIKKCVEESQAKGKTLIGCFNSNNYKKVEGIDIEFFDLSLSTYIHLLRIVGRYVGANTGDMHLAAAVGCKVVCFNPPSQSCFNHVNWLYEHPNITNYTWQ